MEHWFLIINLVLFGIGLLFFLIGFFHKLTIPTAKVPKNCSPSPLDDPPITNLVIGSSASGSYCPDNFQLLGKTGNQFIGTNPYNNLCVQNSDTICDDTAMVTDLKFVDMTKTGDSVYKDLSNRCPNGTIAPIAFIQPQPDIGDAGILKNNMGGSCAAKMGLCVTQVPRSTPGFSPLGNNDVAFITSTDKTSSGDVICAAAGFSGMTTDKVDFYQGCNGSTALYICRKSPE